MSAGVPERHRPLDDPARSLGIIGLIFSVSGIFCGFLGIAGAIISLVAYRRSARDGFRNQFALAGIIVGIVFAVVTLLLFLFAPAGVPIPAVPGR